MGLGQPVSPKTRAKNAKGFIRQIIGNQPKMGMFQRKVISKPQDLSGRAVVVPDPALGMDEVGLPEEMAWKVYRPFVMRDLVRKGVKAVQADEEIEDRSPRAKQALMGVMENRPVIINRAPTLHKFNLMAVKPKLRADKSLAVPTLIAPGFNLDHDGDQMNVYVPSSESARQEALDKLLPSKNLFALRGKYPIHTPIQDAVLGVYQATAEPTKKAAKTFASKEEAIAAYKRGEIGLNDPIEVSL
jgi:DNA-directed RNA polymerase subunit beta'